MTFSAGLTLQHYMIIILQYNDVMSIRQKMISDSEILSLSPIFVSKCLFLKIRDGTYERTLNDNRSNFPVYM